MNNEQPHRCVESNFKVIGNPSVNTQLLLILAKMRQIINAKEKAILTIDIDNSHGESVFEFTCNDNEIGPIRIDNTKFII